MGFKVPRKTALLEFEGEEFEGCEIRVALDITFEAQLRMQELKDEGDQRAILTLFADSALVGWNLIDDKEQPIPISTSTFLQLPGWFGLLVLNGWGDAIKEASGVSDPLGETSKNGSGPEEESVMTEVPSSVLPPSHTPSS